MKKTQLKDTIRNIRKEAISYLSIVIIALLAVTSFLGIHFASAALRGAGDSFYRQKHFRDIEITSTMLLSAEDMKAFENTEGVEQVEGVYFVSGNIEQTESKTGVSVVSLTENINTVELCEGRLPQNNTECVLEKELMQSLGLSVGDRIKVTDSAGQVLSYLLGSDFQITGSVIHVDHFVKKTYVPSDRYVLVNKDAFDQEKLDGCFMKAVIKAKGADAFSVFSKKYDQIIAALKERLAPLNEKLAKEREESVRSSMQAKIDEGEQKLKEGRDKLDESKELLETTEQKIKDGENELVSLKSQLDEGWGLLQMAEGEAAKYVGQLQEAKGKIDAAKIQLDEGKAKLDESKKLLDEGKAQLDEANKQLTATYNEAEAKKETIRTILIDAVTAVVGKEKADKVNWAPTAYVSDANDPNLTIGTFSVLTDFTIDLTVPFRERVETAVRKALKFIEEEDRYEEVINEIESREGFIQIDEAYDQIIDKLQQWNDAHAQYITGRNTYLEKLGEYEAGYAKYQDALAQYNDGVAQYDAGWAKYYEGRALLDQKTQEYYTGLAAYNDGIVKLEEAKKELEEGKIKYAEGEEEYKNGEAELNDAKKLLAELKACHFVMLDKNGNSSLIHVDESANNIGKVGITFAFIFILVGALVIYVTLGRIIGEQRTLVGAQKALGFFSREVLMKYLLFGTTATLIGMLAGTAIGYTLIQHIILRVYKNFYIVDSIPHTFRPVLFAVVIGCGVLLSAAAVIWACHHLLRETARELMQYELPKGKKKASEKSHGKKSSLYSRLIFRNIATDWRRVLITTISIAGCCILLVIGFHMRFSINKTLDIQFGEKMIYEQEIRFDSHVSADAEKEIKAALTKQGISAAALSTGNYGYGADGEMLLTKIYCGEPESIRAGYRLEPANPKETLSFGDHGVLVSEKIAKMHGFQLGQMITLYDADLTPHQVEITGIYDNYLGNYIFMSREAFRNVFEREEVNNILWISSNLDKGALGEILDGIKGYSGISVKADVKRTFTSMTKVLTIITLVLIVAAGMMAYFVLLNLVNMYLNRKKRELVVMRINGFTTKEVLRYVSMESVVTTIAGIILGLGIGTVLGNLIMSTLEQGALMFFHGISLKSWLYSAVITAVFSLVINMIALRKVKHLKLNDM